MCRRTPEQSMLSRYDKLAETVWAAAIARGGVRRRNDVVTTRRRCDPSFLQHTLAANIAASLLAPPPLPPFLHPHVTLSVDIVHRLSYRQPASGLQPLDRCWSHHIIQSIRYTLRLRCDCSLLIASTDTCAFSFSVPCKQLLSSSPCQS